MYSKLNGFEKRYEELDAWLSTPEVLNDRERFKALSKERSDLEDVVVQYRKHRSLEQERQDNREMLEGDDRDLAALAKEELERLDAELAVSSEQLKLLLVPKDPLDEKNIVLEVRAGTGGEEAALFAADIFRMYARYAETRRWKLEILSQSETEGGGLKEIVALVSGQRVYSRLKWESGVHRVQRVPSTEAQGRIHTSACTVAVLPEVEDVEVEINEKDLRIDTYRSSGAGGQHINKTDSAVRLTHGPTGLVVACQDERSQLQNKAKAMKILRARLYDLYQTEQIQKHAAERKSQVGTGDRSERIRTYNFPQNRLTDHRVGLTLYKLELVIQGDLDEMLDAVQLHFQAEAVKNAGL
jgi:peptide chain release factor 1